MQHRLTRWCFAAWLALVVVLAGLHAWHLRADFPNGSPWYCDWAKYTDEGWYGNAAIRAHLFGNWYQNGDFNPAAALPVWPALEWLAFAVAGVSVEAARGLAVFVFFVNLALVYWLVRSRAPRWAAILAVTLAVASPFLYCFSRLAILEPVLTALTLAALNLAVRLSGMRRPGWAAAGVGLLFALMMLTKTTAVFLLPALAWALVLPLKQDGRAVRRCAAIATGVAAGVYGLWLAFVARTGLLHDYRYLFFINKYDKPSGWTWPLVSFWWSLHGVLWVDRVLIPLAIVLALAAVVAWRSGWARKLRRDPVFGASALAAAGYILFMAYQNHPQPRYFTVVAFFSFILLAIGAAVLVNEGDALILGRFKSISVRKLGWAVTAIAALAAIVGGARTVNFATHPQYTFVNAAEALTRYIDDHPNGNRLLISISGDQITLVTHLPSLCDDFGVIDLDTKLAEYQPGWYAAWNDLDPGTLEDLHTHFSLEQVASFPAFDDPERDTLVLFKLHPLPGGRREPGGPYDLKQPLPGDKIDVMIE